MLAEEVSEQNESLDQLKNDLVKLSPSYNRTNQFRNKGTLTISAPLNSVNTAGQVFIYGGAYDGQFTLATVVTIYNSKIINVLNLGTCTCAKSSDTTFTLGQHRDKQNYHCYTVLSTHFNVS